MVISTCLGGLCNGFCCREALPCPGRRADYAPPFCRSNLHVCIYKLTFDISLVKGKTETGRAWSGASESIFTKGLGRDRCVCWFFLTFCFNAGVEGVVKDIPRSIRPLPPHTETVVIYSNHTRGPCACMVRMRSM